MENAMKETLDTQSFPAIWGDAKKRIQQRLNENNSFQVNSESTSQKEIPLNNDAVTKEEYPDEFEIRQKYLREHAVEWNYPKLKTDQVKWDNMLSSLRQPRTVSLDTEKIKVSALALNQNSNVIVDKALKFKVSGESAWIVFSRWPQLSEKDNYTDSELQQLPDLVKNLLIASRFAPYINQIQKHMGVQVEIEDMVALDELRPLAFRAHLLVESESQGKMEFFFGLPKSIAGLVGASVDQTRSIPNQLADWLPVSAPMEIGFAFVTLSELEALRRNDVVYCNRFVKDEVLLSRVRFSRKYYAYFTLDGGEEIMKFQGAEEDDVFASEPKDLQDLSIEMTFSFGNVEMSLKQLLSLQVGYTFQTNKRKDELVNIHVNGQRIGFGRLVDINGKAGIKIVEITGNHGKSA